MKPATREWVRCAEEDFDVAAALLRRRTKTAAQSFQDWVDNDMS